MCSAYWVDAVICLFKSRSWPCNRVPQHAPRVDSSMQAALSPTPERDVLLLRVSARELIESESQLTLEVQPRSLQAAESASFQIARKHVA